MFIIDRLDLVSAKAVFVENRFEWEWDTVLFPEKNSSSSSSYFATAANVIGDTTIVFVTIIIVISDFWVINGNCEIYGTINSHS